MSKRKSKIVERKIEYLIERDERSRALWFIAFVIALLFWYALGFIAIVAWGNGQQEIGELNVVGFALSMIVYLCFVGFSAYAWVDSVFTEILERSERVNKGLTLEKNPWTGEYLNE